ncbi:site-specific integrase [Nocardiopsis ansamitocini]|uniref:site-specific integrase n=1 Tax=Nocardiopsis ansamitocini TaxID=1670832 RepID=UPI002552247D|nr:site-specific integrase [Nocardiopsis ansamitocini]
MSAFEAAAGTGPAVDGEAFGPHVLRHTFGTDLVRGRGEVAPALVDVVLVAELMGHADLNTTRRYTLPNASRAARPRWGRPPIRNPEEPPPDPGGRHGIGAHGRGPEASSGRAGAGR